MRRSKSDYALPLIAFTLVVLLGAGEVSAQSLSRDWTRLFDVHEQDAGTDIDVNQCGQSVLVGESPQCGFVIRYDGCGNMLEGPLLTLRKNGSCAWGRCGEVYISGTGVSTPGVFVGGMDRCLRRKWTHRLDTRGAANGVCVGADGNVYVATHSSSPSVGELIKLNSSSNICWRTTYSKEGSIARSTDVAVTRSGNVFVMGNTQVGWGEWKSFVALYDRCGHRTWLWEQATPYVLIGLVVDLAGNAYSLGGFGRVAKFSETGYVTTVNSSGTNRAIATSQAGDVYMAGANSGDGPIVIRKLNSGLEEQWSYLGPDATSDCHVKSIAIGGRNQIFVSGIAKSQLHGQLPNGRDAFLVKYSQ